MPKVIEMKGKKFDRLTVLDEGTRLTNRTRLYKCKCDCGKITVVDGGNLRSGTVRSCGCLRKELASKNKSNLKHGMRNTSEYQIWINMRRRCRDPNCEVYKDYGGRGIKVCDEWNESFETFYRDVGPRPSKEHSLDRKNTNGDYEPNNCRWATWEEQANNRRNNRPLIVDGKRYGSVYQLARAFNIPIATLKDRIFKWKLSPEEAVKKMFKRHLFTHKGETRLITEWARIYGVSYNKLRYRLNSGVPFEYAISMSDNRFRDKEK